MTDRELDELREAAERQAELLAVLDAEHHDALLAYARGQAEAWELYVTSHPPAEKPAP